MVYDDDTFEPPHQPIKNSDRGQIDIGDIPQAVHDRIIELARTNPLWAPEDIFDQIHSEKIGTRLDVIYAVLSTIGRTYP